VGLVGDGDALHVFLGLHLDGERMFQAFHIQTLRQSYLQVWERLDFIFDLRKIDATLIISIHQREDRSYM
jgi:hypothetical protein